MPTNDSSARDDDEPAGGRDEAQRIAAVKRWAAYVASEPPESWGDQQNRLVNAQLAAARDADLDAEHYRRVADAGREERES